MPNKILRRDFLRAGAAVGAGYWIGSSSTARAQSANDRLNLAVIGLGGQGGGNLRAVSKENIVALCDVDDKRAGKAYETHPQAKKFYDFRKMFDKMESQLDGVVISTPDHTHFHPTWAALQRGKHVYLEKPMAHSVWEVRQLTDLAREKKVATQLGVQRHTLKSVRRSVELIKSGAIGEVKACHAWIASSRGMPEVPTRTAPPPANLKWDLWLGPAEERPYSDGYAPYDWRFFWDFGTGEAGNWGCHILDIPFWALDLRHPTKVEVAAADPHPQTTPKAMESRLDFPANDKRPPVALHWYQGVPEILAQHKLDPKGMNNLFIGTKGMLLTGFSSYKLLPEENFESYKEPESFLYKSPGFHNEWLDACRGGTPASCNFDYSGPMTETVLLANTAYRAGGGFDWNAKALKQTGNDKADQYLRTEFRKGWEV